LLVLRGLNLAVYVCLARHLDSDSARPAGRCRLTRAQGEDTCMPAFDPLSIVRLRRMMPHSQRGFPSAA
jgi:hypothetical protein